jgi:hypothetical protein
VGKFLEARKYFYSAFGSQGAIDTALMSIAEYFSGLETDELLLSRAGGLATVVLGTHQAARWARKKSLSLFNITEGKTWQKGLHDSLLFGTANALVSGIIFYPYIAGCDANETMQATIASSAAYYLSGWYIGQSMDKANAINDDEEIVKEKKTMLGRWYQRLSPRQQLWTNIIVAGTITAGCAYYAGTEKKQEEKKLEERIEVEERHYFQRRGEENNYYYFDDIYTPA